MKHFLSLFILLAQVTFSLKAQDGSEEHKTAPEGWHMLDRVQDGFNGVSATQAYEILKDKESETVVVAVIDSGVDVDHEDLQGSIWVNENEIPGNGLDDDKNGYVDDINGWNFIGQVKEDTYEVTRLFVKYDKIFGDKSITDVSENEQEDYKFYLKVKKELENQMAENQAQFQMVNNFNSMYLKSARLIKAYLDTEELTSEEIENIDSPDPKISGAKDLVKYALENDFNEEQIQEYINHLRVILDYGYNTEFDPRSIIGDDYDDVYQKFYGDNQLSGFGDHGTQVAGVIAAQWDNGMGMNGIADNVKIMAIRAVPDGDERDKDVANAIIYAVDNGADIINMSFGKRFSPRQEAVEKAVRYADSKGVLMVHASGNDHKNTDETDNFPTRNYMNSKKYAKRWIEVGASSWGEETNFVASFSNYGNNTVDVFTPGVAIYTTSPGNEYKSVDGTSFACPLTAGVAALIMSYYPDLSAEQVKDIILKSSVKFKDLQVNKPGEYEGEPEMLAFEELSITGGIVNALEAVKMADSMKVGKKK